MTMSKAWSKVIIYLNIIIHGSDFCLLCSESVYRVRLASLVYTFLTRHVTRSQRNMSCMLGSKS